MDNIIIVTIFRRYESVSTSHHHGHAHALRESWTIAASTTKQLLGFCHQSTKDATTHLVFCHQGFSTAVIMVKIDAIIKIVRIMSSLLETDFQFKSDITGLFLRQQRTAR